MIATTHHRQQQQATPARAAESHRAAPAATDTVVNGYRVRSLNDLFTASGINSSRAALSRARNRRAEFVLLARKAGRRSQHRKFLRVHAMTAKLDAQKIERAIADAVAQLVEA